MPARRDVITNPFISEFVYDKIVNATMEERRFLNGKFAKVRRNTKTARLFSVSSTLEEKALILSKLGVQFAWLFNIGKNEFKQLCKEADGMTSVELTDKMLKENYFVVSDKQFMMFSHLMASNSHSETWMLNRQFLQAGQYLKEWKQEHGNANLSDVKDASPASKWMAKIMLNTIMFSKYSDGILEVNDIQIAVLLYFFSKEKEFITHEELRVSFNGIYRNFKLAKCLRVLLNAKYIEKGEGQWANQYRLTGWGVDIALRFEKKVFSLENY